MGMPPEKEGAYLLSSVLMVKSMAGSEIFCEHIGVL